MASGSDGQLIRIRVDDREARGSGVVDLLAGMDGVVVEERRLRSGDYLIEGKAVLERKRVPDFLGSLVDGRLFAQAGWLVDSPLRAFLILEGPALEWTQLNIKREAVQGAMLSLSVVFGIPVLRSQNEEETARLIWYTAHQLQAVSNRAPNRPGRRPRGKRAIQIRVLTSLPRVGARRAQGLLDHFGTLERIMAGDPREFLAVRGTGKQTAQSIHWAVHEEASVYRR